MTSGSIADRGLLFSFVLLAATVPLSIAASQLALGLVLLFWIVKLVTGYHNRMLLTPLTYGLVAWVAVSVLAALLGDNPTASLLALREEWLFLAFIALWGGISARKQLRPILIAFGTALLLSAGYAIWQHYTGLDLVHQVMLDQMPSGYRVHTTFTHPLTAGAVLSLLALLLLAVHFTAERGGRWLGLLVGSLGLLAAALTYSRSVLLAMAVGLVVLLLLLWRYFSWRALLPGVLLVASILAIAPDIAIRFDQHRYYSTSTGRVIDKPPGRLEIWQTAWRIFLDRPLTGVGEDNMLGRYELYAPAGAVQSYATAHNDLLHVAVTRGVLGVLAYGWLWFLLLRWFWRQFRAGPEVATSLAAVSLAIAGAYLAMSQFEAFWFDEEVRLALMFSLGLLAAVINLEPLRSRSLEE